MGTCNKAETHQYKHDMKWMKLENPLIVFNHIGLQFNQKKEAENQRDFIAIESTI
jgi:hypothetical protein